MNGESNKSGKSDKSDKSNTSDKSGDKQSGRGGRTDINRADLAPDVMGNNSLQGNDQSNVRNQRQAQPDVKTETDGVVESFEKLDKDVRAQEDLGKGNRHSPEHPHNSDEDKNKGS